jgi:hypothetical protein
MFDAPSYRDIRQVDMINELERELRVRLRVYPRWVASGKLDPVTADLRILVIRALIKKLRKEGIA